MAKDGIINIGWDKAEVWFNEYNHKTEKRTQVERPVTRNHEVAIMELFDSTDSGTFLEERVGDVTLFGYANLIQSED